MEILGLIAVVAGLILWIIWLRKESPTREPEQQIIRIQGSDEYAVDAVGESHYQDEIDGLVGGKTREGHNTYLEAMLICDDDNPNDHKAVAVSIEGKIVGHLDRDLARQHRERLAESGYAHAAAICNAKVVGGWDRGDGDIGHYGVKLDLPTQ